jgi:hypothetical protein
LGLKPCAAIRPALLIARKIGPFVIFASCNPGSECIRNPEWDWNGLNMATLADEIGEYPVFFSLLQILNT